MTKADDKPYYFLITRESEGSWAIEFGDFDRTTVNDERLDWLDHYDSNDKKHKKKDVMIVKSPTYRDSATFIAAYVYALNNSMESN